MLVFDTRWAGPHGIGRFAAEVRRRLPGQVVDVAGAHPVSLRGLAASEVLPHVTARGRERGVTYFSPGFTPCLSWRGTHAFTVHDLIHLDVPAEQSRAKSDYYDQVVRRAVRREAGAVLTVSRFSRDRIAEWAGVPAERITVVGNGVDAAYAPHGRTAVPSWGPYVLHVGNHKPHKNLTRLVLAMSRVPDVTLALTGDPDDALLALAERQGSAGRLRFLGRVPEADLPAWYRGAAAVAIPSLYEGFGLPALEGMACGVPVVASGTTALAEVVANAGVAVVPDDVASITAGIEAALGDAGLRARLATAGPERAAQFSWDRVGAAVNSALGVHS
ncbi:glycosyltransferase family 4 protein [Propionibacteriaceae bacterium G1746]